MLPGTLLTWLELRASALIRIAVYTTALLVAGPFLYHVAHGSTAFLGLLEDDYYYYAIVADNLIRFGKLTYDGVTITNGFHPLWFLLVTLLRGVTGRFGSLYYVALTVVFIISILATYELGRRFAEEIGASRRVAAVAAATYCFATSQLLTNGMECVLGTPLFLWLLIELARTREVTPRRAAWLGFLSSLAILARLDLALLVPMFVAAWVIAVRPPVAKFVRAAAAFCAAGFLVPAYALVNLLVVGSWLPVSAMAKRAVVQQGFSFSYARTVALGTMYGPTIAVLLPAGAVLGLVLAGRERWSAGQARFIAGLALVYAFVFFGINALSGWMFFGWYAFPLVPATVASIVLLAEQWQPRLSPRLQIAIATLMVAQAPLLAARYYVQHGPLGSISDNGLVRLAYDVERHIAGREGRFAMGAIAGIVTYVVDRPFLQLEGIVADSRMVQHLRNQDSLGDVLREYGADYLIVSVARLPLEVRNGCYAITQPSAEWAGTRTAKMRGEICTEPIEHFITTAALNSWSVFPVLETFIWDLREARWGAR